MGKRESGNPVDVVRLDEIIQFSPLGVHQYELRIDKLIFIGANKAADKILGINHAELIGKTLDEAFPPLMQTDIPVQYKNVAVSGKTWEAEQVIYEDQRISGAFHVHAFQTAPGKMAAMFHDVTEKRKVESAIQLSEQKLHVLFDNMAQGVMYYNPEGDITEVNASACAILGLTRECLLNRKIQDSVWNTTREDGTSISWNEYPVMKAFQNGNPVKQTILGTFNPQLKQHQWLMIDAIPEFKSGDTKAFRVFATFSDITDRKESEIELRKYNTELEKTKQDLDKSLQSLAAVNKSLLEMQVNLESKNIDLKEKNQEFYQLNQEYEAQNAQLRKVNIRLEENNTKILEISHRNKNKEEQLRIILENSKDIIYSINYHSGIFEYVSPVIKEILGIPDTAFIYQSPDSLFNLMHPDDIPKFGNHWLDIIDLEEKDIFLFEIGYRLRDRAGNYHWMSENNKLLRNEEGKPSYLIGSIRDITELKNSGIALKNSEERLSLAIEATDQGLWDIDLKNNTRFFSPHCFSMLGYKAGEIPFTSETIFSRIHPDEKEELMKRMTSFSKDNKYPILIEFRILHKSGDYVWISSRGKCVERDEDGVAMRIVGTYTDITERKVFELALKQKNEELQAAEEKLRTTNDELLLVNENKEKQNIELQQTYEKLKISEEKFQQLANNIDDIFWLWEGSRLIYLSPSFEKVFGIKKEDAIKNPESIKSVIHQDDTSAYGIFTVPDKLEKEGGIASQFRILKPDGSIRWIWARTFPVYSKEGKLYRLAGIASDITIQKELINELQMAKDKAQESDRLKSTFLANISHEIRTPMNGIIGFSDLLTRGELDEETRFRYFEIIRKSSDQLLHIIEDLIDISKIEANQMQISMSPCDINSLLDEIHIIFSRELKQMGKDNIKIVPIYSMDTENCKIITDGLRLRQIINNLISNAIKFTDKGFIRFGYEIENHDFVKFFVEDSGIGIDPSMFDLIFMPFRQVEEGDARRFGGTGLGLPISLGLVKMLQGKMWLESTKGKGTTFYFNIPYKAFIEKQAPQKATKQEETEPAWGDKRILIVEDDNMNYEFLKAILKPTSIIIERALDGMQAVSMCQRGGFNLVLMDIRIPKLDGLKATRQIRDAGLTLPIIAQTAYAMANDKDKCLAAGCDDYLSKPINKNLLIEILSKYISD